MSQTTNLGLPLWGETPPEGATGLDLRNAILGENEDSMAQLLDAQVERLANKVAEISDGATDDQYPSALAVKIYVDENGGVGSWNDLTDKPFGEDVEGNVTKLDEKYLPDDLVTETELEEALANIDISDTGVSSWNDLTDKPFGEVVSTGTETDILPLTTFSDFALNSFFSVYMVNPEADYTLTIGETYWVDWDGETYKCVAQDSGSVIEGSICIGNGASYGLTGNDEPFVITLFVDGTAAYVALTDTEAGGSHTVRIYQIETIESETQLDNKYLSILDYVEGAVLFDSTFVAIGEDTNSFFIADSSDVTLTIGQTYTVTWNGDKYECECVEIDGLPAMGNTELIMGTGDNGLPFVIVRGVPEGLWVIYPLEVVMGTVAQMEVACKIETKGDYYKLKAGLSSWNDLADKPFGEKIEMVDLIPAADTIFTYDRSMGGYLAKATDAEQLALWQSNWSAATVVWDGTEYDCKLQTMNGEKYIGNISAFLGSGDNGIPFFIAQLGSTSLAVFAITDDSFVTLLPEQSMTFTANTATELADVLSLTEGTEYYAYVAGGVIATATSYTADDATYIGVGNASILGLGDDTGEELFIYTKTAGDGTQTSAIVTTFSSTSATVILGSPATVTHNVSVALDQEVVVPLDSKYLPSDLSGLPEVTTDDNNKVMTVVDGVWTAQTPTAELPTVTTSNNGKVLKVVSGTWAIASETQELPSVTTADNDKVLTVSGGVWTAQNPAEIDGLPEVTSSDDDKVLKVSGGVWTVSAETQELPTVTADDDTKVLTVSGGVWTAQNPASGLPEVTTDDAGKFLRVSSAGTWAVEAIPNAEEASF